MSDKSDMERVGEFSADGGGMANLRAVIDNFPGYVYTVDRDLRIVIMNNSLRRTFQNDFRLTIEPGDSALKFLENTTPETTAEWRRLYELALNGEKLCFIKEFRLPEQTFWQFTFNPIFQDKDVTGIACYVQDITTQKQNEIRLEESEGRLRKSEARLHTIFDNTDTAYLIIGTDFKLLSFNQVAITFIEETLGKTLLEGRSAVDYFPESRKEILLSMFHKALAGEGTAYEVCYKLDDGTERWYLSRIFSVANEQDKIFSVAMTLTNITARKQADESLLRSKTNLRYILDNSETAYLLLDHEFRLLTANKVADQWITSEFGMQLHEGDNFLTHFPESYAEGALQVLQQVLQGTPYSYEAKYTQRNKEIRWFYVHISPITNSNDVIVGLCITGADITGRKQTESEIKALNESLEQKVKERTKELEDANRELEAFSFSVSHDLLAPLRVIDGFTSVLLEDYKDNLEEDGLHALEVIKRNTALMGKLIDDLLNFSRLGRVTLSLEPQEMKVLVNEVIDELRFVTNRLSASIQIGQLKPAMCDARLLKQVWVNLLSNAVKYTRYREQPVIEIGCFEQDGQTVYFIRDNGVGFDMQFVDRIFGVFQRLHKATEFEGTGVGLAIAHRIIEKHKGRIWAKGEVGKGAIFYFTL